MDEDAIMAVLKNSRKVRKQTTCYPCQRRKVKCDRRLPCSVCVSRGHSFLCSYGRPAGTSKPTSSFMLAPKNGDDPSPDSASQLSAFREELNRLHHELHEARKRHKQCEEAEDQVRQLRARCRKYEEMHISLKAGDRSVLTQMNDVVDSGSETSNFALDGSVNSRDPRLSDGKVFSPWKKTPQMTNNLNSTSVTHSSRMNCVRTTNPQKSKLSAVCSIDVQQTCLPVGSATSVQQPQTFLGQAGTPSGSTDVLDLSAAINGVTASDKCEKVSMSSLQPLAPNLREVPVLAQVQLASGSVRQNQRTSPLSYSESRREDLTSQLSPASGALLTQIDAQKLCGQNLFAPSCFKNSGQMVPGPLMDHTKISSAVAWTQAPLFPPMMFSNDLELMEQDYAAYWAKIVVEAQQSTLSAG